jgi:hypothetical protein
MLFDSHQPPQELTKISKNQKEQGPAISEQDPIWPSSNISLFIEAWIVLKIGSAYT